MFITFITFAALYTALLHAVGGTMAILGDCRGNLCGAREIEMRISILLISVEHVEKSGKATEQCRIGQYGSDMSNP